MDYWKIGLLILVPIVVRKLTIKKIVVSLLSGYKNASLMWMKLKGQTPITVAERRIVTGESWNEFCDTIKAAGAAMLSQGTPKDPFNQAEGYRYLSRLVRAGLENFVECNDRLNPRLSCIVDGNRNCPIKMGSDNPDNLYQNACISGELTYRISGTRGTVHFLSFAVMAGQYGQQGGLRTVSMLDAKDLVIDSSNGYFEIIVSKERPQDPKVVNWMRSPYDPAYGIVAVRQTFVFRDRETPAELSVECIDPKKHDMKESLAKSIDDGLHSASLLVAGGSMLFCRWANGFKAHANALPLFDPETSTSSGGDPNIAYYHSYWTIANPDTEVLVIDFVPPKCEFWNFQLNNHWMESLDYRYHQIHVNNGSAITRHNGSQTVRIVISMSDPKIADINWIDAASHDKGTMTLRIVRPEGWPKLRPKQASVTVMTMDKLKQEHRK